MNYLALSIGKVFFTSFFLSVLIFPYFIKFLKKINKKGHPIRSSMLESHTIGKKNTPTLGGIVILISSFFSLILWSQLKSEIFILITITIFFALMGLIDDYLKIKADNYKGLSMEVKILVQFIVIVCILKICPANSKILIFRNVFVDLGILYIPFAAFIIVGAANAVNITDGLDGLAATQAITAFLSLGFIAYFSGAGADIILFCTAFIGAILSFFWFNTHPAKIFMGDVGSLSIGAALGSISILVKRELVLALIGIIFVIETLSVIIQVSYFRYAQFKYGEKRKVFLMAPIHHHLERKGWSENTIVMRFWIISILCSAFTLLFF
ncbi:phospho-N-acetylmuramoyl-pentapeptide-transferase [Wolbachia endosymbiont of Pentidionis agamae]|uniref:phospho-N-acetylmuramoyl-pentapeptide- transferase n=1 Tax=Wolbachia endosymbiont of Pentidionis agamae TaxID=3110435 RepID=UPI002FD074A7